MMVSVSPAGPVPKTSGFRVFTFSPSAGLTIFKVFLVESEKLSAGNLPCFVPGWLVGDG